MNSTTIYKFKWFWHWQDDKEEVWLAEMAKMGWHLTQVSPFGKYLFQTGEPQHVIYRLDFVWFGNMDGFPVHSYKEEGWEYICELMGCHYLRKSVKLGETGEIINITNSKVQSHRRMLGFLAIFSLPIFFHMINLQNDFFRIQTMDYWIKWVFIMIEILILVMAFFYIYILVRVFLRIKHLERSKR